MPLSLIDGTGDGRGVERGDNSHVKVWQVVFDTIQQRFRAAAHNNTARYRFVR
jgi:hypothetical protein